jgi:hypothetical protein
VTDLPAVGEEPAPDTVGFVDFDATALRLPTDADSWSLDIDGFVWDPAQLTTDSASDISFSLDPNLTLDFGNLGLINAAAVETATETTVLPAAQESAAMSPLREQLFLPMIQR